MANRLSIQAEQMRQLFDATPMSIAGGVGLAAIFSFGQYQVIARPLIAAWFAAVMAVSALRVFLLYRYRNAPADDADTLRSRLLLFRSLALLSAALWGAAGVWLSPSEHPGHQLFLLVLLAGLTSGAIISLSADLFLAVLYPVVVLLPAIVHLAASANLLAVPTVLAVALYLVFMVVNARRLHRSNYENIAMRLEAIQREADLRSGEEQLRLVLEGADLGFWDWNIATGEVARNERWTTLLGYEDDEIRRSRRKWEDFIHPDDRDRVRQSISDVLEGRSIAHKLEYRMLHKDGSIRWIFDQANVMARDEHGRPTRMSGTHSDVTERKQLETELQHQAHIDYLTGVSNRGRFMAQGELELGRATRYGSPLSLLMLDIDLFKQVNDTHGHKAGDMVLKKLAEVCGETLREVDVVGRLGGEEFAILLPETDMKSATEAAERLRAAVKAARVSLDDGLALAFSISIGVTARVSDDENMEVLLNRADKALYEAKNTGRDRVCVAVG